MNKIVYLFGGGATQAEADYKGGEKVNLLMNNRESLGICGRIINQARKRLDLAELLEQNPEEDFIDIEKFISLLANTGSEIYIKDADEFRQLYYEDILKHLAEADLLRNPKLVIGLLEMHKNGLFKKKERLTGIINLNHDNLVQTACQKVRGGINLGFDFESEFYTYKKNIPPILKLHGSFNWKNAVPIKVLKLEQSQKYSREILWIPPTILKESKKYPFNKLMGLAYELLIKECDVLRIIGCSLSQNDWNIISLLFDTQYIKYNFNHKSYSIELIMNNTTCERIIKDYACLKKIITIDQLEEGIFDIYSEAKEKGEPGAVDNVNTFEYWLRTKVRYHIDKGESDYNKTGKTLKEIVER